MSLAVGSWQAGHPTGITLHHTADRSLPHVIQYGIAENVGYHLIIDRDGSIHQTANLNYKIYHAGKAMWLKESPNRNHIAVAVVSWGRVERIGDEFKSWTGAKIPHDLVAHREGGYWDQATSIQESALWTVIKWLVKEFKIDPRKICGHSECAIPKGRKDDPKGVLSLTMDEIRQGLL
jgi:N-acetyl-anhydromuramyl-L-alanine amidase AmpD